jgi:HK97 family phage portal protein
MRLSSVWACVSLLTDLVSTLPIDTYRAQGAARVALPTPALLAAPSATVSPITWRRQVMASLLLRGNAYGLIARRDRMNYPTQIEIVAPDSVQVTTNSDGTLTYRVNGITLNPQNVWHLAAYVMPGSPIGLSPIQYAAQSIGLGLDAEEFGAEWFANGAHPSSVLSTDQEVTEAKAKIIKERFRQAASSREPVVLSYGVRYEPIQIAPNESQFLETTRANVATIARYFRVPPEMIGGEAGNSLTYANVEQRAMDLLTYTVGPWVARLDEAFSALLPSSNYVRHNVDALLRVDLKSRYDAHGLALRTGWKSVNEVRALEDLAPIADGDQYLWPPFTSGSVEPPENPPNGPTD